MAEIKQRSTIDRQKALKEYKSSLTEFSKIMILFVMLTYYYAVAIGTPVVLAVTATLPYYLAFIGTPVCGAITFYASKARGENINKIAHGSFSVDKKVWDFSKIILFAVYLTYFYGVIIGTIVVWKDPSQIISLLSYIGSVITISIAFYLWKAYGENKAKGEYFMNQIDPQSAIINGVVDIGAGIINNMEGQNSMNIQAEENTIDPDIPDGGNNMSGAD